MNRKFKTTLFRGLILVGAFILASSQSSFGQRKAGITLGFNSLNALNVPGENDDFPSPKGFEFGLNISRWRSDKQFVTTSLTFYRKNSTLLTTLSYDNMGRIPVEHTIRYRSTRLDFIFSKVLGSKEMDDDFFWYRNAGFGIDFFNHTEVYNYYTIGKEETNDFLGIGSIFPSLAYGIGMQKNLRHNLILNVDMNLILNSSVIWAIQPKVGLYYRLY
ncbi:MAG: hypothetical protein EP332_11280 [Bacteroidetes bacterium]|nr:MAG: hypothetical protein EP332_11280 [Bacteroidota bacterium]